MRYQILGPFDVFDDAGQSLALGGERQRALLALLVLHANEVVSVDRIVDSLWDEDPPDTASNVIQVYVSRLRKALEPQLAKGEKPSILLTRRPGYLLRVVDGELDADLFEVQAAAGRDAVRSGTSGVAASVLRAAIDLWHGEALADFAYEDFASAAVSRLTELKVGAIEDLVDARMSLGHHDQLVPILEGIVDTYPFREHFWGQLMLALYRSGRQADALRAFRTASETLVNQLGIDPGPELRALEGRILDQDPKLLPAPPAVDVTDEELPLIGRSEQVAALADAVSMAASGENALVRIIGEPGAGVTRLLDEAERLSSLAGLAVYRGRAFGSGRGEHLADTLTPTVDGPSSMILQSAESADATALNRLRSRLANVSSALVVVGHVPLDRRAGRALDQLAWAAGQSGSVVTLTVARITRADIAGVTDVRLADWLFEKTSGDPHEISRLLETLRQRGHLKVSKGGVEFIGHEFPNDIPPPLDATVADLPADERLVVEICAVANAPIPLKVISGVLDVPSLEAVSVIDRLVGSGFLEESHLGITVSGALGSGRMLDRIGATRRSAVAERVANAWGGDLDTPHDSTFGYLAFLGGDHERASTGLIAAADRAMAHQDLAEAQPLFERALDSLAAMGEDSGARWGHVHLGLAEIHRLGGWPNLANSALDEALSHTTGAENVNAWGWAAQVASDRQDPIDAEWRTSIGQLRARECGEPAKAASLLSLQARVLNRVGFAAEADQCSQRAQAVLAEIGAPQQRFMAAYNQAWMDFDRGFARRAESGFASLIERIPDESDARHADLLAWHARSLFRVGRVSDAAQAADAAVSLGNDAGNIGPVFLAYMARAEGAAMFGLGSVAVEAATEMLDLVLQQLPAWENAARFLLAKAHLVSGNVALAADEVANATEACPSGVAGLRWRLACDSLSQIVEIASGRVDAVTVDHVVHQMLTTKWHEAPVDLLIAAAEILNEPTRASQATELAVELGLASAAGRGLATSRRLGGEIDGAVEDGAERLVRAAVRSMPNEWGAAFNQMLT